MDENKISELGRIPFFVESFQLPSLISRPPDYSNGAAFNNNDGSEKDEDDNDGNWWEVLPGVINAGAGLFGVIMQNRKTGENEFIPSSAPLHASPPKDYGFLLFPIIAASALIALYILKNKS